MNLLKTILAGLTGVFLLVSCTKTDGKIGQSDDTEKDFAPLYVRMADSEINRNPDPRLIEFRTKPKWEYTHGLLCLAIYKVYEKTNNEKYLQYAKYYADSMISENGTILTYKQSDFNIDRINPGKLLFKLISKYPEEVKYKLALETLRDQMRGHPRTSEGGFWHKKRYPHQMWLDGLYMGSPFLAQYALEMNEPELFDDVVRQVMLMDEHIYDAEKKLYRHGWDESREQKWADDETGLSPEFWGRAMGWFSMALVDILDYLPQDHEGREDILRVIRKVADGIILYQDEQSGVWWQVLDKPNREGNYLEASCSSMFSYFLLKSINKGYLGEKYKNSAVRAYEGVKEEFVETGEDGLVDLTQICAVAGLGGDPYRDGSYEYYVGEPVRKNDPKGVGPFIMAGLEFDKLSD